MVLTRCLPAATWVPNKTLHIALVGTLFCTRLRHFHTLQQRFRDHPCKFQILWQKLRETSSSLVVLSLETKGTSIRCYNVLENRHYCILQMVLTKIKGHLRCTTFQKSPMSIPNVFDDNWGYPVFYPCSLT